MLLHVGVKSVQYGVIKLKISDFFGGLYFITCCSGACVLVRILCFSGVQ